MRNQVLHKGMLLDEDGQLFQAGYATSLVKAYQRSAVKAGALRIKEWDYYLIYNKDFGIALTLADNSYMGLIGVSVLDFKNRSEITKNVLTLLPLGRMKMPATSKLGDVTYQNKKVSVSFLNNGEERHLIVRMKHFKKEKDFFADVTLTQTGQDSMVIATPFSKKKTAFYYNQKIVGMQVTGCAMVGEATYSFGHQSMGLLDWGRGAWTYDNTWYWSAAQGIIDGKNFGFNLGYGFGNTSKASENMLFYEGAAHKLDDVLFEIPKDSEGKEEYTKPWRFTSSDHRFEMAFEPILDRSNKTSAGIILSDQHQVFGYFTGNAILDDGTCIKVKDFLGFAEKVHNKW